MNLEDIKYDAFISYRHCDLDQYVAVTLHKELEAFRLPKYLQKTLSKKGITKKKIERVFRDRDELPITNNLADPITNALRNSEYLLVICTPRLPESIWCKTEVETFIKMHGREKVFAVLAEGEPAESFPEALLFEEKEVEDENGNKVINKVPVEPLAADVRGADKKEIRKKIKEEVLRLAAPMFDCSYDDLKQRHREQKIRRILTASACATAVFGAFAVVSTTMALRIHQQSGQIKDQAAKIEEQYTEALKVNAKGMAEDALELVERGDRKGAVEFAYNALTGTEEEPMPYTAEAEYALSQALSVYQDGSLILPVELIDLESEINSFTASLDGSRLLVEDVYGNIIIYEPDTGKMLTDTPIISDASYSGENEPDFLDNSRIVYRVDGGIAIYNIDSKEENVYEIGSVYALAVSYGAPYLFLETSDGVAIYHYDDMSVVFENEEYKFNYNIAISSDGKYAACSYVEDEKNGILLIDIENKTTQTGELFEDSICEMYIYDGNTYVATYSTEILSVYGNICCYDSKGNVKWKKETDGGVVDVMRTFGEGTRDKLVYNTYDNVTVLDIENGEIVSETNVGDEVVSLAAYEDSNRAAFMTRNGVFHILMADSDTDYIMDHIFRSNSSNISDFCFGGGYFVSASYNDTAFAIYRYTAGNKVELCAELDFSSLNRVCNLDESLMAMDLTGDSYKTFGVLEIESGSMLFKKDADDAICDKQFNKDGNLVILSDGYLVTYNPRTGDELERLSYVADEESIVNLYGGKLLADCSMFYAYSREGLYLFDAKTGDVLYVLEGDDFSSNITDAFDVSSDGKHYAYGDEENGMLIMGTFGEDKTVEVSENFRFVSSVSYLNGVVYVTRQNGNVISYNAETGQLMKEYTEFNYLVKNAVSMNGYVILECNGYAYILNENLELVGGVEGYATYSEKNDCFFIVTTYNLYTVPRYTLDMLLEEAKEKIQ